MSGPLDSHTAANPGASHLFFGVGVGVYDHPQAFGPLKAAEEVADLAKVMAGYGYAVLPSPPHPALEDAFGLLDELASTALASESCLVVLWAGHGEPTENGGLHLVSRNSRPGQIQQVTSSAMVKAALRSGASQILVLLDTCFAEAGAMEAMAVARRIEESLPSDGAQRWIGILPAALAYETARDGVFGAQLLQLLREGPTDPALRLRWSAHNAGIRGDDVIDCLVKQWRSLDQTLVPLMRGNAGVMLPNPRYDRMARDVMVEQLLVAARGISANEEGDFFTGRVEPLADLVAWIGRGEVGVALVSGPAGCGKSALLGRVAALSDPRDRKRILEEEALCHADPGERSVAAAVAARGANVADLVRRLEAELVLSGLLPERADESRNRLELLGAVERLDQKGTPPLLLIDGLEEAGSELTQIVAELLRPLAGVARLLISSRPIPPRQEGEPPPLDALQPALVVDLGALEGAEQTQQDLAAYGARRLDGVSAAMNPTAVAGEILRLVRRQEEGGFLLARLITARLRQQPLDTAVPNWQRQLAGSVAEALDQELEALPVLVRGEERLPQAARELLAALAWAYGQGFPVEEWALAATALSPTGTTYGRQEVFWLLSQASRWVVESGEWGQAVYRLSHQRLADHLRPPAWARPWKPVGDREAVALAEELGEAALTWCRAGRPPEEQPYLWTYFWAHAVDGGAAGIDRLRELSQSNPAFLPNLAMALNNLGAHYSNLGRWEEALPATEEAVATNRELVAGNAALRPNLAMALSNLGIRYSELGRREEALPATEEAVATYRELVAGNAAFRPNLAMALSNLGIRYSELGRREEALRATQEAVATYLELVAGNAALRPDLAMALNNLGNRYSEKGRHEDALLVTEEAVVIRRELAVSNAAFRPNLANALISLGAHYSKMGLHEQALSATDEAESTYRELAASNSAFRPGLAKSLNNLGAYYSQLGLHEQALSATEEAVATYRELVAGNVAFRPDLANALDNLGVHYSNLERREEALPATDEAVATYRELATGNPAFRPDLANALANLGIRYSQLERWEEALSVTEEAVATYRELVAESASFRPDLAMALNNLGSTRSGVGTAHGELEPC
jgi:tetratricopeptide (TPR) repeat protein